MKDLIRKYRAMPYEERLVVRATLGLCFSVVLTSGKFLIGLFTDVGLCVIAVYTFAILLAKFECVRGARGSSPKKRSTLAAVFLFVASVVYSGFMGSMAFAERRHGSYGIFYVAALALISFCEFGFAVRGIIKTQDKGYSYLELKVIDFCIATIAVLTTQVTILDYTSTPNVDAYNSFAGMGVGILIAVSALFILAAPKIVLAGHERQAFLLRDEAKNELIDVKKAAAEVLLVKSSVFGSYVYRASVRGPFVDGRIVRTAPLWSRMNVVWKIFCIVLSELLIFAWLLGRAVFFLRSMALPQRLGKRMAENGFESVLPEDLPQMSVPYSS